MQKTCSHLEAQSFNYEKALRTHQYARVGSICGSGTCEVKHNFFHIYNMFPHFLFAGAFYSRYRNVSEIWSFYDDFAICCATTTQE